MITLPDKKTYKTTITQTLRNQIIDFSKDLSMGYLEIGCDQCYSLVSVCDHYTFCLGVDIDNTRIKKGQELISNYDIKNISLLCGDSSVIPPDFYDVILIDANHDYDFVFRDMLNCLYKNKNENKFIIILHDYGLKSAGVKRFSEKYFEKIIVKCGEESGWNPLGGPIDDYEAVYILFDKELKEKTITQLREESKGFYSGK